MAADWPQDKGEDKRTLLILSVMCLVLASAAWEEPARGSTERRAVMDVLYQQAERLLGKPEEFVVSDLRRVGDVAFASVDAQRPGRG